MKAIVYKQYGSPDVLKLADVEKPMPKDGEVLIAVHAVATNPADWHLMRAKPFLARMEAGLFRPKNQILGFDIAGTVEAAGHSVTRFKVGDEVFGAAPDFAGGGFAEFIAVPEANVALKPANVSFEGAASVLMVGFTAIQGLRGAGTLHAGQSVLINGASGGIGTFAVQYAKSFGATVTGVCSGRNADFVRSLGADDVIDYTKEDFTSGARQYDVIFDTVGNRSAPAFHRALNPNGIAIVAGFTTMPRMIFGVALGGALYSRFGSRKIGMMATAAPIPADLECIRSLLESGKVKPVIEKTYPFAQTADAIRHLETGRVRGKVVVTVA